MRTFVPDRQTFLERARPGARQPVVVELPLADRAPAEIYHCLRRHFGAAVLLESGKGARYSYVGRADGERFVSTGRSLTFPGGSAGDGDPFDALRELLAGESVIPNERLRGFSGGYVGYLGYDMARHIERLPELTEADPPIPDCQFVAVELFVELDHDERLLRAVASLRIDDAATTWERSVDGLMQLVDALTEIGQPARGRDADAPVDDAPSQRSASLTQQEFEGIVRRAKEYIRSGDIFQVNLSVRIAEEFAGDPLALYQSLRDVNPSPYMALLELPGIAIVSASPELLVRVRERIVETRPIAGTRPRGATPEEDERNIRKLTGNEKERAEHLMLVDLERNDIGRVARYGSVSVDEFMGVELYSHVIHIVSHVRGELAAGRDLVDAIRACFPGGTITGAPKVRSMEIIEELEPQRRGVYTGSIGWLGFDGNAELNIAIRTIVIVDSVAYVQAGAGIVADSEPAHEYRESLRKAEAALVALERARNKGTIAEPR